MNIILSFSQNKQKQGTNNSAMIAKEVQTFFEDSLYLEVMDYPIQQCLLCGKCSEKKECAYDKAFNKLIKDIGQPETMFFIVPYYSPIPSGLMMILEKLNEIYYASWIADNTYRHSLSNVPIGLIVHGGTIEHPKTISEFKRLINQPLVHTFKNLQFRVMEDSNSYSNGLAFGIEDEGKLAYNENNIFPDINHSSDYIHEKIKDYVLFVKENYKSNSLFNPLQA